jgi:hypothetical protein
LRGQRLNAVDIRAAAAWRYRGAMPMPWVE